MIEHELPFWEEGRDLCPCYCDIEPPAIRFRFRLATGFTDNDDGSPSAEEAARSISLDSKPWNSGTVVAYTLGARGAEDTTLGDAGFYFDNIEDLPASFCDETGCAIVHVEVSYIGDGNPWQLRVRLLNVPSPFDGTKPFIIAESLTLAGDADDGEDQILVGGESIELPVLLNYEGYMIGAPGKLPVEFVGWYIRCALQKRGFFAYRGGEGLIPTIYRSEVVTSGGFPGCDAEDIDSKVYSGQQNFTEKDGDPSGSYHDTRSDDLKATFATSFPMSYRGITKTFGKVTDTETTRVMTRDYKCDGSTETESLHLALGDEYDTDELTDAVQAILDAQVDPITGEGSPFESATPRLVAKTFLSKGEIYHERMESHLRPSINTSETGLYSGGLSVEVRWKKWVRHLDDALLTPSDESFTFELSQGSDFATVGGSAEGRYGGAISVDDADAANYVAGDNREIYITNIETDESDQLYGPLVLELVDMPL